LFSCMSFYGETLLIYMRESLHFFSQNKNRFCMRQSGSMQPRSSNPFGLPRSTLGISFEHDFFDGHVDGNYHGERDVYVLTVRMKEALGRSDEGGNMGDVREQGLERTLSISWGREVAVSQAGSTEELSRTNLTEAVAIRTLLLQDALTVIEGSSNMEPQTMLSQLLLPYVRHSCPMKIVLEKLGV